jgi:hypothetical protein
VACGDYSCGVFVGAGATITLTCDHSSLYHTVLLLLLLPRSPPPERRKKRRQRGSTRWRQWSGSRGCAEALGAATAAAATADGLLTDLRWRDRCDLGSSVASFLRRKAPPFLVRKHKQPSYHKNSNGLFLPCIMLPNRPAIMSGIRGPYVVNRHHARKRTLNPPVGNGTTVGQGASQGSSVVFRA